MRQKVPEKSTDDETGCDRKKIGGEKTSEEGKTQLFQGVSSVVEKVMPACHSKNKK
jgi:hypothetical protein